MRRLLIGVLALLCLAAGAARAQSCETFADTPPACAAHLPPGTLIYVPASLTLQNLSDATDALLASAVSLPPPCGFFAARQICLRGLRVCAADGQPAPLCPTVCTDFNDACSTRGLAQSDCSAPDPDLSATSLYATSAARNASIPCVTSTYLGQQWAGAPSACAGVLAGAVADTV